MENITTSTFIGFTLLTNNNKKRLVLGYLDSPPYKCMSCYYRNSKTFEQVH